jgi:hypothetical protein
MKKNGKKEVKTILIGSNIKGLKKKKEVKNMIEMHLRVPNEDIAKELVKIYEAKGGKVIEIKGDYLAYFQNKRIHVYVDPEIKMSSEDLKRFLLREALYD